MVDQVPAWLPVLIIISVGVFMLGEWEGWWRKKKAKKEKRQRMNEKELIGLYSKGLIQGSFVTWLLPKDPASFFAGVEDMTLPQYIEAKKQEYMAALETPGSTPLAHWYASAPGSSDWAERKAGVKDALFIETGDQALEELLKSWLKTIIKTEYGWQAFSLIYGYNEGEHHDV